MTFGRSRETLSIPEGLRVCVASGGQACCAGVEGANHTESRESAQGEKGNLAATEIQAGAEQFSKSLS